MIPGINPRQMRQAMKKLGMKQEEIEAEEVIIKCPDKTIIISNPSVSKVNMMGQTNYQVSGEEIIREKEIEISEEDIKTVTEQTGCSRETAIETIKECNYDLAEAILKLSDK